VQLASHKVTPKKTDQGTHETTLECFNIIEFVKELEPYICKSKKNSNLDERNLRALRLDPTFHTSLNIGRKQLVWLDKQLLAPPLNKAMETTLSECKIPWLVPACNKDFLSTIEKRLFPDGMIAGLIPSKTNKRFDAFSYALGCSEVVNWAFEFKARSKDYNLTKAIKDLEKKCEEIEVRSCHAMLIAYCETSKSAASAWVDAVSIRTPKSTQKSKLESKLKLVCVAIVFGDDIAVVFIATVVGTEVLVCLLLPFLLVLTSSLFLLILLLALASLLFLLPLLLVLALLLFLLILQWCLLFLLLLLDCLFVVLASVVIGVDGTIAVGGCNSIPLVVGNAVPAVVLLAPFVC